MAKQTGPKSVAGKQKSSENSVTHGCRAKKHRILRGERQEDFDALRARWFAEYGPDCEVDVAMLERLVEAEWRMLRCERQLAETEEFLDDTPIFEWTEEQHKLLTRVRKYFTEAVRLYNMARRDLDGMRLTRKREIVAVHRAELALRDMALRDLEVAELEREEQAKQENAGKVGDGPVRKGLRQ